MHEYVKSLYYGEFHPPKYIKFIHSEKATKFSEISTLLLSYVLTVKSEVEILENFVAFSEYLYEL